MQKFDFKSYHFKAMNADTEAEKALLNQQLKQMYENLNASDKVIFNQELQHFLVKEMSNIKSVYEGATGQNEN